MLKLQLKTESNLQWKRLKSFTFRVIGNYRITSKSFVMVKISILSFLISDCLFIYRLFPILVRCLCMLFLVNYETLINYIRTKKSVLMLFR